jgi:hypothetical protein
MFDPCFALCYEPGGGKLCIHGVIILSHRGVQFHEILKKLVWNGFFYVSQIEGLSIGCSVVERLGFVARVVCAGGESLTPWRCQDNLVTCVGVTCGSFDVYAVHLERYRVVNEYRPTGVEVWRVTGE